MNYYNEYDKRAAASLRELIADKLIPAGEVDERSICEVKPDELKGYSQCHFFAGISGWCLALRLSGWPESRQVWTGSCPCQPFSAAGKGLGQKDERHLWPVFFDLIRQCRPGVIFGEQVASSAVIGRPVARGNAQVQEVLDKQAIERVLQEQEWILSEGMQELRKPSTLHKKEEGLLEKSSGKTRTDFGCGSALSSEQVRGGVRPENGGYKQADRKRILRVDWDSFRSDYSEVVEYAVLGSNNSGEGLYDGQREGSSVLRECNESELGSKSDHSNSRCDKEQEEEAFRRFIIPDREGTHEEPSDWLSRVQSDLGGSGYAFGAAVITAAGVFAPHIRQRLYWSAKRLD
jgi:hypothetical protein